jgi:hypothetical protein
LELEETDPFSVATAFFQVMYQFDSEEMSENALIFLRQTIIKVMKKTLTAHWQQRDQEKI